MLFFRWIPVYTFLFLSVDMSNCIAKADVALFHLLVGIVDVRYVDDLDVMGDVVLGAEVENLMRLCDVADQRAGDAVAVRRCLPTVDRLERPQISADDHGGVALQQR